MITYTFINFRVEGQKKRTQLASINTSMGNKGSSIINIKQIHVCHQEE